MRDMKDYKVGERFELKVELEVQEFGCCDDCVFCNPTGECFVPEDLACTKQDRKDGKYVIFKMVKSRLTNRKYHEVKTSKEAPEGL